MQQKKAEGEEEFKGSRYDVGLYSNICAVLGDNPLLWFLPVGGPTGTGWSFPLRTSRTLVSTVAAFAASIPPSLSSPSGQERNAAGDSDDPEAAHPAVAEVGDGDGDE